MSLTLSHRDSVQRWCLTFNKWYPSIDEADETPYWVNEGPADWLEYLHQHHDQQPDLNHVAIRYIN